MHCNVIMEVKLLYGHSTSPLLQYKYLFDSGESVTEEAVLEADGDSKELINLGDDIDTSYEQP